MRSAKGRALTTLDAAVLDRTASSVCEDVAVQSPAPREVWGELVRSDPDALPTQSPAWLDCVCAVTGARDASRLYSFADGRRFVLPLAQRGRGILSTYAAYRAAWGFGGLVGSPPREDEVRAVLNDLRGMAALQVRVRPNPLRHEAWAAARPAGVITIPRRAHVIDLREGFEAIWKHGFSKNARTDVRRAERHGVRVEADRDGRLLPIYWDLYMRSVERWARRQHEPAALARWRAARRDSMAKLERIIGGLHPAATLWVAWVGQRPAAAMLVLRGSNAHDTRGVMDLEVAGPTRANYLLQRHAIEDACDAGCLRYHMGETGESRSLAHFKESFGARPHVYAEYLVEALPLTRADRALRSVVKRALGFRDVG